MENTHLKRINELAAIAKTRPLTPEEEAERQEVRKAYMAEWRKGFVQVLDNTYLVDDQGNKTKLKRK
jgi:uncharacterized protein YnzC (UPF0291/DUF896 family)